MKKTITFENGAGKTISVSTINNAVVITIGKESIELLYSEAEELCDAICEADENIDINGESDEENEDALSAEKKVIEENLNAFRNALKAAGINVGDIKLDWNV